jgi:hypothetical protein
MALPLTRNFSYAPDDPVKSADLNDIQDQIIALFAGKHGEREIWLGGGVAEARNDDPDEVPLFQPTFFGGLWQTLGSFTSTSHIGLPLTFPVGTRLKEIEIFLQEDASTAISAFLMSSDPTLASGGITQISGTKTSGTTNARSSVIWTSADADLPLVVSAALVYGVMVTLPIPSGDITQFNGARVLYDRP